jgi:predicted outer membrane repeat protein
VTVGGTVIEDNTAREGGGAIFFVSDDNTGTLTIDDSALHDNPSEGFSTAGFPGIFFHSAGHPIVSGSTLS